MKKTKTLFDQAIEIIENKSNELATTFLCNNIDAKEFKFYRASLGYVGSIWDDDYYVIRYTRLLLARELWNDGQEKYWKQCLFK